MSGRCFESKFDVGKKVYVYYYNEINISVIMLSVKLFFGFTFRCAKVQKFRARAFQDFFPSTMLAFQQISYSVLLFRLPI